jgi:hypothetical protein
MAVNGTTTQRGYGSQHQAERKRWSPIVAAGSVVCWRCHRLIIPGTSWDLGHNDQRTAWTGPEHRACNRRAGGIRGNRSPKRKKAATWRPQPPRITDLTWQD